MRRQQLLTIIMILSVCAYMLPWLLAPSTGLTFGANDLAEWASLHPKNRQTTLPLLTSLLLRLPLACLIIAYNWSIKRTLGTILITVCILVLLLPPMEILTTARNDVNYIQQSGIMGITLIGSVMKIRNYRTRISMVIVGMISGVLGTYQAYSLMKQFQISVHFGTGVVATIGLFVSVLILLWHDRQGEFTPAD